MALGGDPQSHLAAGCLRCSRAAAWTLSNQDERVENPGHARKLEIRLLSDAGWIVSF